MDHNTFVAVFGGARASEGYGPELHVDANAVSDPKGNEADATTGWTEIGLNGTGANYFVSQSDETYKGDYAFKTSANDTPTGGCRIKKTWTGLEIGATYRLRFAWRHLGAGVSWAAQVDWGSGIVALATKNNIPADLIWEEMEYEAVATDTEIYVQFRES